MKFVAEIDIMPLPELLDPQGKAVKSALQNLSITATDVRVGKHIRLELEANSREEAYQIAQTACQKLLANPIIESYSLTIHE
ncbi:MAG: phosphoribosylformylglycinamidine synthase subunit PurS [Cytophagales bacterium]|nr:phosphoribosylformylglycinamidine synthase subunit PurS [Cytophagales bacterium]MDW8384746.1 phosphoribosylformylglycinamidine synthase subunit PurS [Flammeovirgaceae bacterium]